MQKIFTYNGRQYLVNNEKNARFNILSMTTGKMYSLEEMVGLFDRLHSDICVIMEVGQLDKDDPDSISYIRLINYSFGADYIEKLDNDEWMSVNGIFSYIEDYETGKTKPMQDRGLDED